MQNNRLAVLSRAKRPAQEFGVALASVLVATLARFPLSAILGSQNIFITFFPAVIVSAWLGGLRGGISATVLSALSVTYLFLPPIQSLLISRTGDQITLLLFLLISVGVSALGHLQREGELELAKSEARYRLLLETANEGALRTDTSDRITFINRRMSEMLGYGADELLGASFDELLFPEDVKIGQENRKDRKRGTLDQFEMRFRCRDGSELWALTNVTVIHEDGAFTETFGLFTDITQRRRAEANLDAAFRRETQINQIGQAIRNTTDPAQIQTAAVRSLGAALHVDRAFYQALDVTNDIAWIEDDFHRKNIPSIAGEHKISDFAVEPAAYYPQGKTLVLRDVFSEQWSNPMLDALRAMRVRSCISVPLFEDGMIVGTLVVAMSDEPRDWTAEEVSLVESIAVQTRSALDRSLIHQREHRIAAELQKALLPKKPDAIPTLDIVPFMKPALDEAEIGGDFYDVFTLDDRYSAIVIGDVSGKGLAAAAQLALIRNSLRTTLYLCRTPALSVSKLNQILTEHDLLVGFVTAFVAVYDKHTGQMNYSSCGHEPGLVRRAETGEVLVLETDNPPLGATDTTTFLEASFLLREGDVLFLYTDGLSEAGPNRRRLLGTDGLREMLSLRGGETSLEAMAANIVADTTKYAQGTFRDDVCLLLARQTRAGIESTPVLADEKRVIDINVPKEA